jgi:hypothetical protein
LEAREARPAESLAALERVGVKRVALLFSPERLVGPRPMQPWLAYRAQTLLAARLSLRGEREKVWCELQGSLSGEQLTLTNGTKWPLEHGETVQEEPPIPCVDLGDTSTLTVGQLRVVIGTAASHGYGVAVTP